MYFQNFDLESVVTPVNIERFEQLLYQSKYDQQKISYLMDGFKHGFSIGYEGPTDVRLRSPNLKFRGVGNKTILWNKVMKEVSLKHYAGPFKQIPFSNFIQSLIGLVPKDNGKNTRLIFHLSYPRGKGLKKSVHANTPKSKCTVEYPEFNRAIQLCLAMGKNCKIAKSDMTATFRQLGIRPDHFKYLVMMAESPIDGKNYFFVDKCLPFGSSISCKHFQEFSNAVAHVVQSMTRTDLLNYLDNFFFVALLRAICNQQVDTFLKVCQQINFPVSLEKTFRVTTLLTFLGMLIDTVNQTVSIPSDKILKAKDLIGHVLTKRLMTVKQLQKICGFLNFLGRAIVPRRAFTRRMYMKLQGTADLKPHHHIRVTKDIKQDLLMWNDFIHHPSVYCRGFMDFSEILTADDILMFSDASKNPELGMGGICNNSWMYQQWNKSFVGENDPSIEFLELYAVLATVLNWLHRFKNRRIVLFVTTKA